jgi:hypothetical protein
MPVTIDGEARLGDDSWVNPDGTPATWVEEIPKARRRAIFAFYAVPGAVLTVCIWIVQAKNNVELGGYIAGLVPFALFAWLGHMCSSAEALRRVYSMHIIEIGHQERLWKATKWIVAGMVFGGFSLTLAGHNLAEYWWAPTTATLIFWVPGAYHYFRNRQMVMTPEAAKAKSYYIALTRQKHAADLAAIGLVPQEENPITWTTLQGTMVRVFGSRGARYMLAIAAFGFAGYVAMHGTSKDDSSLAGFLAVVGALLALDAILWLLGAGIVIAIFVAVFKGIAALPVSVAVIIGALIIASAVSDKK